MLELAPGTGIWTSRLVQTATSVTAVDAASEMLAINRAKVASSRVLYIQADLFAWQSTRVYDGIFCGFWLSHVPLERLDPFLSSIAAMLRPGGKFFFADSQPEDSQQTPASQANSQLTRRRLNDGQTFEIVKNFYDPQELTARFAHSGLEVEVQKAADLFIYGAGRRR